MGRNRLQALAKCALQLDLLPQAGDVEPDHLLQLEIWML